MGTSRPGAAAIIDPAPLPEVSTGNFLYQRLEEEVARATRYRIPLCCIVFRVRTEVVGAPASRLTRAATLLARRIVRQSDVVGVLGPGCFGVVANASGDGAEAVARSVAAELDGLSYLHEGREVGVEVSCGAADLDGPKTAREMLEEARAALELASPVGGTLGHC